MKKIETFLIWHTGDEASSRGFAKSYKMFLETSENLSNLDLRVCTGLMHIKAVGEHFEKLSHVFPGYSRTVINWNSL